MEWTMNRPILPCQCLIFDTLKPIGEPVAIRRRRLLAQNQRTLPRHTEHQKPARVVVHQRHTEGVLEPGLCVEPLGCRAPSVGLKGEEKGGGVLEHHPNRVERHMPRDPKHVPVRCARDDSNVLLVQQSFSKHAVIERVNATVEDDLRRRFLLPCHEGGETGVEKVRAQVI